MPIEVLYKDYNLNEDIVKLEIEEFDCWDERGNYTLLYKRYFDKECPADIIIPTSQICWIKPKI